MIQAERYLHAEVIMRLRTLRPDCVVVPVPNGTWLGARSASEHTMAARLIARMKAEGQIMPGVADLLFMWGGGSGAIELKRPAEETLLGKRPAGRPTDTQKEFAASCAAHGVRHIYATSWGEVHAALSDWGRLA